MPEQFAMQKCRVSGWNIPALSTLPRVNFALAMAQGLTPLLCSAKSNPWIFDLQIHFHITPASI
jgi:hypothetical protein